MKIKTFKELHRAKLTPAMEKWAKKNPPPAGVIYKFIVKKDKNLFILLYDANSKYNL
jgi:hypothetical protein